MHYLNQNVPIPFGRGCPREDGGYVVETAKIGVSKWLNPTILDFVRQRLNLNRQTLMESLFIHPQSINQLPSPHRQPLFYQIKLNASILRNTCRQQLSKFKNEIHELNSIPIRMTNIRQSNRQSQFLDKPDLINYS